MSRYTFISLESRIDLHIVSMCICKHGLCIYLSFYLSTHLSTFFACILNT